MSDNPDDFYDELFDSTLHNRLYRLHTNETENKFKNWESMLTSAQDYPNNNESRLAIQTLKTCIVKNPINDILAKNAYALFDYAMFCYFAFRIHLCDNFSHSFVELYDSYLQNLLPLYFLHFYNIPQDKIIRLILQRSRNYERIMHNENAVYKLTAALTEYIEKDLEGTPEYDGTLITSAFTNFQLHTKLSDAIIKTLTDLEENVLPTFCITKHISSNLPNQDPILNYYANKQASTKESKNEQKKEEFSKKRSFMSKTKERFSDAFGSLGTILYFILTLFVSVLPFVMIDANFFITFLLILLEIAFPFTSIAFWIWGLICAINGPQDWVVISYYIAFTVLWLPYYISVFLAFFKKSNN